MATKTDGITRRKMITGAGGMAALGVMATQTACGGGGSSDAIKWDKVTDIVTVGSGIGGATAAAVAKDNGDEVIIVEKAGFFGGTSSKTAGVIWVPNSVFLRDQGISDSKDDCLRYLARFSFPRDYHPDAENLGLRASEYALLEAFYDNASVALDRLIKLGVLDAVEWRMWALDRPTPDYLDNVEENKVAQGRAVGVVDAEGNIGQGIELMGQMDRALKKMGVPVLLKHAADRLVTDDSGRVIGLIAKHGDQEVAIKANKGVIFASGGYSHNTGYVADFQRVAVDGSCAMPVSTGDFLKIASDVGAKMGNMSGAWRMQLPFEQATATRAVPAGVFYVPGDSMLQVNKYGRRVVNEKRNYNDRSEIHGVYDPGKAEFTNHLMFMVYDQRTAEAFAGNFPIPVTPGSDAYTVSGTSVSELSGKLTERLAAISGDTGGVVLDSGFEAALGETIQRFNGNAVEGRDPDFSRGASDNDTAWHGAFSPMRQDTAWPANPYPNLVLHPLDTSGPLYAIILTSGTLDTNGGPVVNQHAQIMNGSDVPVEGLYGAGNCIASPSKEAYWGAGCPLGLSMTYGYIAANRAHAAKKV
jgi:hypothetical protein